MKILGIDPGSSHSAFVLFNGERVSESGFEHNHTLLRRLIDRTFGPPYFVAIEGIESYGMPVGRETFDTCFWGGRFAQAAGEFSIVYRSDVKLNLCHTKRVNDKDIKAAVCQRFGGARAIGTKALRGPLYTLRAHEFSALAVAITHWDTLQQMDDLFPQRKGRMTA